MYLKKDANLCLFGKLMHTPERFYYPPVLNNQKQKVIDF